MAEEGRIDLSHVRMLVLDEADKLFDMGFTEQVGLGGRICCMSRPAASGAESDPAGSGLGRAREALGC